MECGEEHNLASRNAYYIRKLLQEVQLFFWIVFGSMFQHFTKLIDNNQQEFPFLLAFGIIVLQAIKNAGSITLHVQSLA